MTGTVTTDTLKSALNLSDDLKKKIQEYETKNWAANLSAKTVSSTWQAFINKLGDAIKKDHLSDDVIIDLIQYLSTLDTANLLEEIGNLNPEKQKRFLDLMNWIVEFSPDENKRNAASNIRERVLMAYRLANYPNIYSSSRIERAMQVLSSSTKVRES
jgi:hypothetical protein